MVVVDVLFEVDAGEIERGAPADSLAYAGRRWRIICEDGAVSILGDAGILVGSGRWTGKGIAQRYAPGAPLDSRTWSRIENTLRHAIDQPAAAEGASSAPQPPPAPPPAPEEAGYLELIVELSGGRILHTQRSRSDRRATNAFEWKVVVDGDQVTVHASDEPEIARARWNGKELVDRAARSRRIAINDYQWDVVERAVSDALGGVLSSDRPRSSSVMTAGAPVEARPARPARAARAAGPPPDRRSGWWALGALGLALAGTLISWASMPPGDDVALGVTIALAVLTLGLAIYAGYGAGTRCPSCRAWYRRETTNTEETGSHTYTKQESKSVYDNSGKQIGTTYETATYERTSYRYHYQCKECRHKWTGTGSSERRIS